MRWEFHPVGVCTVCGWPISREHLRLINERCGRRADGHHYKGVYALAMNPEG